MVIALLALLGVNLIVIVVLLVTLLGRKRWVSRRPGAFRGAIRVTRGQVPGLGPKWKRGYGHWVHDVLIWTKAPLLLRNETVAAESLVAGTRTAEPGEIRRLGKDPVVVTLAVEHGATVEIASRDAPDNGLGPFAPVSVSSSDVAAGGAPPAG